MSHKNNEALRAALRTFGASAGRVIKGAAAVIAAHWIHAMNLDIQEQWGRAYYRCHECGEARDCVSADDLLDYPACACDMDYCEDDLRISESWVEQFAKSAETTTNHQQGNAMTQPTPTDELARINAKYPGFRVCGPHDQYYAYEVNEDLVDVFAARELSQAERILAALSERDELRTLLVINEHYVRLLEEEFIGLSSYDEDESRELLSAFWNNAEEAALAKHKEPSQ